MVAVPFIYFSILFVYVVKKKKTFDVSAYLISIYLVSSAFSIIIDIYELRSTVTYNYNISLIPTVLYCFLLTIVFYPFIKMPSLSKLDIVPIKPKFFNAISYLYIFSFIIICFFSLNNVIQILNGDMGLMRLAISRGEEGTSLFTNAPAFFRPFLLISSIFTSMSMIMLLFYFYSLCYLKKSKLFNILLFLSSTSIIIIAILGVDRSKVIYWMLSYVFMLILFWKKLTAKQHKNIIYTSLIMLSFLLAYFLVLTFSRFENSDTGADGSIFSYAGQSFINFCYFFDMHPYQGFTLQKVFPLFYKLFIDNGINSSGEINVLMTYKTGVQHGIFNTFIGDILMSSNSVIAILYCLIISRLSFHFLKFKKNNKVNFSHFILLFCFYSIPLLGLFSHFYNNYSRVFCFLFFVYYAFSLRLKKYKLRLKKYKRNSRDIIIPHHTKLGEK